MTTQKIFGISLAIALLLPVQSRPSAQSAGAPELVPVQWLEPAGGQPAEGEAPKVMALAETDPRVPQAARMIDNEAARFIRTVIAAAWRRTAEHRTGPLPPLPILFQPGGNHARQGFQLIEDGKTTRSDLPYVVLDFDADRLSQTLLHEGGHVADRILRPNRSEATWSALPHSTFAVTDPVTALGEGYATHFETLWGYYGSTPERRAYYHRTDPMWTSDAAMRTELIAPARDIMTFSQNWARFQSVRDELPVFEGHVYPGEYLRSQYDPARDRARLRTGSALVSSEGTVASTLFWIAQGAARQAGAAEGRGLDQPAVLAGETELLAALQRAGASTGEPQDLIAVVSNVGEPRTEARRSAVQRFVTITRGATSRGDVRTRWRDLYQAAIGLDLSRARELAGELNAICRELVEKAIGNPAVLRAAVGPVLPVRLDRVQVSLKALGAAFPVEMDLNALGAAELQLLSSDEPVRAAIERALDEKPFASFEDFERRSGATLARLQAVVVH